MTAVLKIRTFEKSKKLKKILEETDTKDVEIPEEVVNLRKRLII